ncbi:MAG: type II toxin-antitoxin system RelE/ParE family toxin [Melioribacteraceae bacterium]|nr:type II toxin-antitoxin system RelE/ParE family toxin [Melioribacteraceae bacterium]
MKRKREIIQYRNYFEKFYASQLEKVKTKIDYVLYLVTISERIPKKFFKYIEGTDGLFEIRIKYESNIFRIFCCFDEGNVVVLFNGFQKKSNKTPKQEIKRALRIKIEYFERKSEIKQ